MYQTLLGVRHPSGKGAGMLPTYGIRDLIKCFLNYLGYFLKIQMYSPHLLKCISGERNFSRHTLWFLYSPRYERDRSFDYDKYQIIQCKCEDTKT